MSSYYIMTVADDCGCVVLRARITREQKDLMEEIKERGIMYEDYSLDFMDTETPTLNYDVLNHRNR